MSLDVLRFTVRDNLFSVFVHAIKYIHDCLASSYSYYIVGFELRHVYDTYITQYKK